MGNTHSSSNARMASMGNLVTEVGNDIQYDRSIGTSRFLRAVRAKHRLGPVVVKTFVKPDPSMSLKSLVKQIRIERESLADLPNVLTYQKTIETERAGYLIRQWLHSNLYDRISTRPFLSAIEKKWISYQLLHALRAAHGRKIPHGDLKCENILVTTSLMVYVTDFASSFKPTFLPLDDPSDFSFFFDTSGRRSCYIAPERFYEADSDLAARKTIRTDNVGATGQSSWNGSYADLVGLGKRNGKVTEAMDVFSLGCVIAELWRDGAPTFTLSQLFKYREGMFDIDALLLTIPDEPVRELVRSMIALDPAERKTFDQHITDSYVKVFPASFYDFFHQYLVDLQRTSTALLRQEASVRSSASADGTVSGSNASAAGESVRTTSQATQMPRTECDERIEQLYEEWSTIVQFFDHPDTESSSGKSAAGIAGIFAHLLPRSEPIRTEDELSASQAAVEAAESVIPVQLNIPGLSSQLLDLHAAPVLSDRTAQIVLSVILANMRNCLRPSSKCHALDLLLHLSSKWLTDETKLDRVIPFVITLFDDESVQVRMAAIRACTQTLMLVKVVTPSNASIFSEYIMPNVKPLGLDPSTPVRCTLAACIVPLAETGERFLQMAQAMRAEGLFAVEKDVEGDFVDHQSDEANYDMQLKIFQDVLQDIIVTLLTDPSASVKRALITNIAPLCSFFGMAKTNDVLLSHMITYLNDRNWLLREAFFHIIVSVAKVSGNRSLEEYILPLMTQALSDSEEHVVYQVISGLRTMMDEDLFDRRRTLSILELTIGFLCHPNLWLREAAAGLIAAAARKLEEVDVWTVLYPSVRPLLAADVHQLTELNLLDFCKQPLSRPVFSAAVSWASQAGQTAFWKAPADGKDMVGLKSSLATEGIGLLLGKSGVDLIKPIPGRTEEDDRFLDKLRSIGMADEDLTKLIALRGYIRRLAKQGSKVSNGQADWDAGAVSSSSGTSQTGSGHPRPALELQSLDNVTPQTIFFSSKTDAAPTSATSDAASVRTGTFRSQEDDSFSAQIAKRRLLGQRTSSDGSLFDLTTDIRRRMLAANGASGQYSNFSTRLADLPEEKESSKKASTALGSAKVSPAPMSPMSIQAQARLGPGKASAAVAPSTLTATGTMTDPSSRARTSDAGAQGDSHLITPAGSKAPTIRGTTGMDFHAAGHPETSLGFTSTYDGKDPYIRAHLEAVYFKAFRDRPELGPKVPSGPLRRRGAGMRANTMALRIATSSTSKRRPEGRLIAYFTEHTGPVTCLAVSPDHLFFVSGSQDGTLKVWDTARLEKNVTSKSRATYTSHKGSVTSVIAIEGSHCVASTATDGSLHVWRIDVSQSSSSVPRYAKPKLVSNFQLSTPEEYATCLIQCNTETSSNLILGTSHSRLTVLDLRTMQVLQTLRNPVEFGPITCLCVDKKKAWLVVGTLGGVVCLWDMRFGLRLRSWRVGEVETAGAAGRSSLFRVNRIAIHPSKGRGRWILVAFENINESSGRTLSEADSEVVIVETWDIDRGIRVETFESISGLTSKERAGTAARSSKLQNATELAGETTSCGLSSTSRDVNSDESNGLSGAAAAIERLLQRQAQSGSNTPQARSSDISDAPTNSSARPSHQTNSITWTSAPSVKALFVSLEGYSSSSLSHSASVRDPGAASSDDANVDTDGTQTDGGEWLDVARLAQGSEPSERPSAEGAASITKKTSTRTLKAGSAANGGPTGPGGYMITGGQDAKLRFWDLGKPEKSSVFGVPPIILPTTTSSQVGSTVSSSHSSNSISSSSVSKGTTFVSVDSHSEFKTLPPAGAGKVARFVHTMKPGGGASASGGLTRLKSPLLSNQTGVYNQMPKTHKDAITDLLVIESPFRCIVASDRSGCLRVWE